MVPGARCVLDAGPAEFLSLFQNASYVCTNSFHGTVFSVQFHRPFFTSVAPSELAEPEHSRTFSILSRLGLTNRIVGKGDTADLFDAVDWSDVDARLQQARQSSLTYLRAALSNAPFAPLPDAAPEASSLPQLADHNHCTGCGACASVCPGMPSP